MNEIMENRGYKDRRAGLIVFGIAQIFLGGLCLLLAPLTIMGFYVGAESGAPMMSMGAMIVGAMFYAAAGVWLITMGIGSVMAKRWARALILASSWFWLAIGAMNMIYMAFMLPAIFRGMVEGGQIPAEAAAAARIMVWVFMFVFYIVLPGILVLFYGGRHVRATCEALNPRPSWTDRCPIPVLAMVYMFAMSAFFMLWMPAYNSVCPVFGVIYSGTAGTVLYALFAVLFVYLTWGFARLQPASWWAATAFMVLAAVSGGITFARNSLAVMYEKMGFPEEQVEMIMNYGVPGGREMIWWIAIWGALILGYFVYIKRYFRQPVAR